MLYVVSLSEAVAYVTMFFKNNIVWQVCSIGNYRVVGVKFKLIWCIARAAQSLLFKVKQWSIKLFWSVQSKTSLKKNNIIQNLLFLLTFKFYCGKISVVFQNVLLVIIVFQQFSFILVGLLPLSSRAAAFSLCYFPRLKPSITMKCSVKMFSPKV